MGKVQIPNGSTFEGGILLAALAYLGWGRGGLRGTGSGGDGVGEALVPGGGGATLQVPRRSGLEGLDERAPVVLAALNTLLTLRGCFSLWSLA